MEIVLVAILTALASFVGTVSGFGLSTIMIPILVIFFPPVEAIFLVAIIHWFGDVWKIILFRSGFKFRLILLFGFTGLLASYLGASITLGVDQAILLRALGITFIIYSMFLLVKSKFKLPASDVTALVGGLFSGFFAGLFGIGGAIRGMFLSAFNLPKEVYIATAGAIGLMVDITRIVTYVAGGTRLSQNLAYGLIIFVPASFLGASVAKKVIDKTPQKSFRLVVAIFLLLVGLKLLVFP